MILREDGAEGEKAGLLPTTNSNHLMLQKILIIAAVLVIMIFSSGCTPHSNGKWIEMEGGRIINLATVQTIHTSAPNTFIYFDRDSWQFSDTKEGDATFQKIRRFLASGDSYLKIK